MKKKIAVFLFDGFSDWEISYFTPEIRKSDRFDLVFFSESGDKLTSMGGLEITPSQSLNDLDPDEIHMLVIPGGAAWENGKINAIEKLVLKLFNDGKHVAAICAATTYLGKLGLLNNLKHTSNALNYLKSIADNYSGDKNYQNTLAVRDRNLITANGIAPVEFSKEIFLAIGLYNDEHIEKWFQLFKNGVWSG